MITSMVLIDIALVLIVAGLGNEFRLIIDEKHDARTAGAGQHDAATIPGLIPALHLVSRHHRVAEDRELFERVAYDFECARMTHPTDQFVVAERK